MQVNTVNVELSIAKSHYVCMSLFTKHNYSRVKNGLIPRIRTFREITFFMLCVTRIFKSYFECPRLVTLNRSNRNRE
jgi:hypothetical protein